MKFSFLILILLISVSCNFHSNTSAEIRQKINKLQQQIDQRHEEEILQGQLLDSVQRKYLPDNLSEMPISERLNRFMEFDSVQKPILNRWQELIDRNSTDELKIEELVKELRKLEDRNPFN
jgi:hypothetical protein